MGENESPDGGDQSAQERAAEGRGGWLRRYLGEEWVEVEPGVYRQSGPAFRTVEPGPAKRSGASIDETLGGRAADEAAAARSRVDIDDALGAR